MHKALGKQLDYVLDVEPVEFPSAAEVIAKVRASRGVMAPLAEEEETRVEVRRDAEVVEKA